MNKQIHFVLLHGWAMHSGMWGSFAQQLSANYRVTLIDLPHHENLAQISDEIIAGLDSQPFYVIGWSLGGAIALDMATRYSNRVQGVILLAANPCFVEQTDWAGMPLETFDAFATQLHANSTVTLQRFLALQLQGLPQFLKEVKARFALHIQSDTPILETSLQLLKKNDLRENLKNLTCPIAAILSDNDALIPVFVGEQMQALQPHLQLTILEKAGHIPFITQPTLCLNAIHAFVRKEQGGLLDKTKIKQSFGNASQTYDSVAQLQRDVGQDLLKTFLSENLTGTVVDLGCGTGFLTQTLLPYCENADLMAVDLALPMLQLTREKIGSSIHYLCSDAESLALATNSVETLFSNVALQWCFPIDNALRELQRVLKPDGTLIFSTFSSQTLCELKTAWASVDNFAHVNEFYTQELLQLALEKAGFSHMEIITKRYVSRYDSVLDLMRELKHIGAHNVSTKRKRSVTTKTTLAQMMANYPQEKTGEISATFEVIFVRASQ
ncbi:MAG: malonyl-ACP O-methyltransferase BioC [Methylococcales bacterium]|nr:malonyl-ACP O-methyltransferase BioC [Methylococcales bacterium]